MHGFRFGRIFGIDIRIDWSWLFIVVLLTWNLSAVFSAWHPGWPIYGSIGVALTASLLFFGCILLHELAHSAVAKRFGVRVRSITLFLFGGVSNIEREPPSPNAAAPHGDRRADHEHPPRGRVPRRCVPDHRLLAG